MGYAVYITRKKHWSDQEGPVITHTEWMSYVQTDRSLRLDMELARRSDPEVAARRKEPTHATWTKNMDAAEKSIDAAFWMDNGNIVADSPSLQARIKLFLIADGLQAKLEGEKGEIYGPFGAPETGRTRLRKDGRKRRWWQFW